MLSFYILQDSDVPGCVKVGKDTAWPGRYKQARCHSPGTIEVAAVLQIPTQNRETQSSIDRAIGNILGPYRRLVAVGQSSVREWYDISPAMALDLLRQVPELRSAKLTAEPSPSLPASQLSYEDWRDRGSPQCRWRAFLFQVLDLPNGRAHPHVGRLKLTAGSLYDTAYRYNFTYCPFPVVLVGGFETGRPIHENNRLVMEAWKAAVSHHGRGAEKQPLGWMKPGTVPGHIREVLSAYGCCPFPLRRPKPADARPRDSSVSPVAAGAAYPLDRVRDAFF